VLNLADLGPRIIEDHSSDNRTAVVRTDGYTHRWHSSIVLVLKRDAGGINFLPPYGERPAKGSFHSFHTNCVQLPTGPWKPFDNIELARIVDLWSTFPDSSPTRGNVTENKRFPVVPVKEPVPASTDIAICATTLGCWRGSGPEALPLSVPTSEVMAKPPVCWDGVVVEKASDELVMSARLKTR
jgi:hypothetical protein